MGREKIDRFTGKLGAYDTQCMPSPVVKFFLLNPASFGRIRAMPFHKIDFEENAKILNPYKTRNIKYLHKVCSNSPVMEQY